MSYNNLNPHITANEAFFNQEGFYNANNGNANNVNATNVNAVPVYPINNADHSSGPSSAPQLPNTYNYYDNNYLVTNYFDFINNYISIMNNSINYFNNSSNTIRQMTNELGRMHYNLDYYYYNLYRNNLRVQNNYNHRQYYNIPENEYRTQFNLNQQEGGQEEGGQEEEPQEEPELEEEPDNDLNDLGLEFDHNHYQELSNTNINNCIDANINNVTFNSIGNPVNNTCAISQDEFDANEEVSVFNHCGHIFKKEPLNTWLLRHQTCPNCRFNILTNSNLIKYSTRNGSFKYFLTLDQFRHLLANNIMNRFFNNGTSNSSNNSMSFVIRR